MALFEIFSFDKEQLVGFDTILIDVGVGLELDISELIDFETERNYYQQILIIRYS